MARPNWFVALSVVLDRVPSGAPSGVTVLDPRDHHVTLAFLGPIDEHAALAGWTAAILHLAPKEVALGTIEPLGRSAITVHVDDASIADAIRSCRDAICDAASTPRDDREALPHVTIARISGRASATTRTTALEWARSLGLEHARIDRVALYTKAAQRGAQRYRIVRERLLR